MAAAKPKKSRPGKSRPGGVEQAVSVTKAPAMLPAVPTLEIMGDARRIAAVISGGKNARKEFLAGGFRVRGNLRYLSDVAMELGILKIPL